MSSLSSWMASLAGSQLQVPRKSYFSDACGERLITLAGHLARHVADGKPLARSLEFGTTGLHQPLRF